MWNDTYQLTQLPYQCSAEITGNSFFSGVNTLSGVDSHEDEDLHMNYIEEKAQRVSLIALIKDSLIKTHLNPLT